MNSYTSLHGAQSNANAPLASIPDFSVLDSADLLESMDTQNKIFSHSLPLIEMRPLIERIR